MNIDLEEWFKTYQGSTLVHRYDSYDSGIIYSPVAYDKDHDSVILYKYDIRTHRGYVCSFNICYSDLSYYKVVANGVSVELSHLYDNSNNICNHNWVTTKGFSTDYIDCSICGAKKEDS